MDNKSILIIITYDKLYPPINGGTQRGFYMLPVLADKFNVTVLLYQDIPSFLTASKEYPSLLKLNLININDAYEEPKDIFRFLPLKLKWALRTRWLMKSLSNSASSTFLKLHSITKKLLKEEKFDTILLEELNDTKLISYFKKWQPGIKVVYEAHNVVTDLAIKDYQLGLINYNSLRNTKREEQNLHKITDMVVCMSEDDKNKIKELNKGKLSTTVIPTGVPLQKKIAGEGVELDNPIYILFCGSLNYQPNYEGLDWYYKKVWPIILQHYPELKLLIIGSGTPDKILEPLLLDSTVEFKGRVDSVWEYYNKATLSIVPILSGSGIRLKIMESLSMGVPVISTTKGAEGLECTDEKNILIADSNIQFADKVIQLLNNKNKRLEMQLNGRQLVKEKYDWDVIGRRLETLFNQIASDDILDS